MYDYSRNRYIQSNSGGGVTYTPGRTWNTQGRPASSGGGRGGGTTYQSQQGPSQAYLQAQAEKEEARQKLIAAAAGLAQLVADELGITAGLECFTTGDLGACGETALNVATMFVGGLAGKIAIKYGLRWGKAAELGRRIAELGGDLIEGVEGLVKSNRKIQDLDDPSDLNTTVRGLEGWEPGNPLEDNKLEPIKRLSDRRLLQSINNPDDDPFGISIDTGRGVVENGNHRRHVVMNRADDPSSSITWDTPIKVDFFD